MSPAESAKRVTQGDVRIAARLMRDLDDRMDGAVDVLKELFDHTGGAYVVGITGNPGSGKSTVVDALITAYRKQGKRVGVVAVDPTSPFSGGAILGDRIRMQKHATDEGVFIRSLATRGNLGGLSRSTTDVVTVLDAMGFDVVLVETVGVGQDEVEIVSSCHTTVVVTVPGLGDDIQAIKAGVFEIADILVVNKADREGADHTARDLLHMLELRDAHGKKEVPILKTIATRAEGIDELLAEIAAQKTKNVGAVGHLRAVGRAAVQITDLVKDKISQHVARIIEAKGGLEQMATEVAERRRDPYSMAEEIVDAILRDA